MLLCFVCEKPLRFCLFKANLSNLQSYLCELVVPTGKNILFLYRIDETGTDKPKADKTAMDEIAVDEPGQHHSTLVLDDSPCVK